jgi:hypothetical protein
MRSLPNNNKQLPFFSQHASGAALTGRDLAADGCRMKDAQQTRCRRLLPVSAANKGSTNHHHLEAYKRVAGSAAPQPRRIH